MIGYLKGTVLSRGDKSLILLTNSGVGYTLFLPLQALGGALEGSECSYFVETIVREDAITLYGFPEEQDKQLFLYLIEVDKVGPKLAMTVLSAAPVSQIVSAILGSDVKFFKSISGIGAKTSEKIIIDLKDKVKNMPVSAGDDGERFDEAASRHVLEAETGLAALGYNRFHIKQIISKIEGKDKKRAEDIVREALKLINEQKK